MGESWEILFDNRHLSLSLPPLKPAILHPPLSTSSCFHIGRVIFSHFPREPDRWLYMFTPPRRRRRRRLSKRRFQQLLRKGEASLLLCPSVYLFISNSGLLSVCVIRCGRKRITCRNERSSHTIEKGKKDRNLNGFKLYQLLSSSRSFLKEGYLKRRCSEMGSREIPFNIVPTSSEMLAHNASA